MEDPFIAALTLLSIPRAIVINSLCLFMKASLSFWINSEYPFGDSRPHQSVHVGHFGIKWGPVVSLNVNMLVGDCKHEVRIGITGKYAALRDAYASIDKALEHSGAHLSAKIDIEWIDTTEINPGDPAEVRGLLEGLDGVIVPGGFGVRGTEGKIACVRYCRENQLPYLGICLGFQMAVVEFARHVAGLTKAASSEFSPDSLQAVIDILPEQKQIEGLGGNMRLGGKDVQLAIGSLASHLYGGRETIRERFRHRYEVDPKYIDTLEEHGLHFSGRHPRQPIMQMLELPTSVHPYFLGAQFHPELTSRPLAPSPMFMGLIAAAVKHANPGAELPACWLPPAASEGGSATKAG